MVVQKFWWNIAKGRRKCLLFNFILLFINMIHIGEAVYAEADDLINELDRPSK
jgi:hypothetical protein